ncbi:MAG: glycosyltransferase family 2 protein [Algicola sp.]|nr:glycosyltransferase family 2 protein [Algicola sp.]
MKTIKGMHKPKVALSVIVPVYNGSAFIESAYQSVIKQDIHSFEILFVDNNSTDNSVAIIKRIAKKDPRVILAFESIQGAGAARNKGIALSKGTFISFLDVDDSLYDNAYKILLKTLKQYPDSGSVFGKTFKSYRLFKESIHPSLGTKHIRHYHPPYLAKKLFENVTLVEGTLSYIHRREVFDVIGGFPENIKLGEDVFFHLKLTLHVNLTAIDYYVGFYYRHQNSTVSQQNRLKKDKVFTYWQQYTKAYLPYYFNNTLPDFFALAITKLIYGAMGKMIALTKGYQARVNLFYELKQDIQPVKVPVILNIILLGIVVTGSVNLYKFYFHYVLNKFITIFKIKNSSF